LNKWFIGHRLQVQRAVLCQLGWSKVAEQGFAVEGSDTTMLNGVVLSEHKKIQLYAMPTLPQSGVCAFVLCLLKPNKPHFCAYGAVFSKKVEKMFAVVNIALTFALPN
jgi:hypothetical protein